MFYVLSQVLRIDQRTKDRDSCIQRACIQECVCVCVGGWWGEDGNDRGNK